MKPMTEPTPDQPDRCEFCGIGLGPQTEPIIIAYGTPADPPPAGPYEWPPGWVEIGATTEIPPTALRPVELSIHDGLTGEEVVRYAPNPGPVGNGETLTIAWDARGTFTAEIEPEAS